jgi:hypothetical protein
MDAFRPKTDEAIAMFVTDRQALWNLARRSKTLEIEFPTRDVGTKKAVFETGGLNPARMPGWD